MGIDLIWGIKNVSNGSSKKSAQCKEFTAYNAVYNASFSLHALNSIDAPLPLHFFIDTNYCDKCIDSILILVDHTSGLTHNLMKNRTTTRKDLALSILDQASNIKVDKQLEHVLQKKPHSIKRIHSSIFATWGLNCRISWISSHIQASSSRYVWIVVIISGKQSISFQKIIILPENDSNSNSTWPNIAFNGNAYAISPGTNMMGQQWVNGCHFHENHAKCTIKSFEPVVSCTT
ncbi:hypothetical protein RFI_03747 [Reticulomyxa filosa]|uniref:Uncharacterized protein n=1 Tax=Reticulomyxa filosa TaxID=46433 RepID=X6P480_RETFI|nr:hypothetical protein RFI_03747 [Reticulomyxa filosa]|eukprot:ETO33360.1 hypothetical protein RFI_03747 [Reticulomyxa filosa]